MTIRPTRAAACLLLIAGLAGCEAGMTNPFAASSGTESFVPVTTEAEFRAQVIGREVLYANGAVGSYGPDGTWSVVEDGSRIGGGSWTWGEGQWCREGETFEGPVAPACETVEVSGSAIRFTQADGSQGTLPFRS